VALSQMRLSKTLITHVPLPGAVEALRQLAQDDYSVSYATIRNSIQAEQCQQIHEHTRAWTDL